MVRVATFLIVFALLLGFACCVFCVGAEAAPVGIRFTTPIYNEIPEDPPCRDDVTSLCTDLAFFEVEYHAAWNDTAWIPYTAGELDSTGGQFVTFGFEPMEDERGLYELRMRAVDRAGQPGCWAYLWVQYIPTPPPSLDPAPGRGTLILNGQDR